MKLKFYDIELLRFSSLVHVMEVNNLKNARGCFYLNHTCVTQPRKFYKAGTPRWILARISTNTLVDRGRSIILYQITKSNGPKTRSS